MGPERVVLGAAVVRATTALRPRALAEEPAERGVQRPEPGAPVRLGLVSDNPAYTPTPALAFALRPGAPVDARLYSHQRPLAVAPSGEGLVRVALSPADLGLLRPDLGDIRVVDAVGRQWRI